MYWKITDEAYIVTVGGNWYWQSMTGLFTIAYTAELAEHRARHNGGRTCVRT